MIGKLISRNIFATLLIGALLFGSAGTFDWPGAWVFLALLVLAGLGGGLWLARTDPELLAERLKPIFQRGTGRSQRYTIVPSSMGSLRAALASTSDATGAYSDRPKELTRFVPASSRSKTSPRPMARATTKPTAASSARNRSRPRVTWLRRMMR